MTTYYGLYGQKVQYLASDPTDVQIGQVWYNSTSATLKVRAATTTGAWATGGNLASARRTPAGAGTQTAGLGIGGYTTTNVANTEEYDGTSWTAGGNLNTARASLGGAGTQTAGLGFAGTIPGLNTAVTEEYDGTSWTNSNNLASARRQVAGAGTQTAGLCFGGIGPSSLGLTATEEYDGSSWSGGGNLNTARYNVTGGSGPQTAALVVGGTGPGGNLTATEFLFHKDEIALNIIK
jgi:hypothetical protein